MGKCISAGDNATVCNVIQQQQQNVNNEYTIENTLTRYLSLGHGAPDPWCVSCAVTYDLKLLHDARSVHGAVHPDNIFVRHDATGNVIGLFLGSPVPQRRELYPVDMAKDDVRGDLDALGHIMISLFTAKRPKK